jgi:hypothetical protein
MFVVATATSGVLAQTRGTTGHSLTIYVDEGGPLWGHVIVALTDGTNTVVKGWRPEKQGVLAPWGGEGGIVADEEGTVSSCQWDVKKTYEISPEGYQRAMKAIVDWKHNGQPWARWNHCGDFAETIARMAGAPIDLPENVLDPSNRPGQFGEYLRTQEPDNIYSLHSLLNTGLRIQAGDRIQLKATGTVRLGENIGSAGPDGKGFFLALGVLPMEIHPSYNLIPAWPHGSLIGRVFVPGEGTREGWSYIGSGKEIRATRSGILELNLNDTQPEDNLDDFQVSVKVCKAPN